MGKDKRIILSVGLLLAIGLVFWAGSRYPALNQKALMGGSLELASPISFDAPLRAADDAPVLIKILSTAGNWAYTNRYGMTFGVLFGAALMTLLPLLKALSFKGSIANSLLGVTVGAPLGVCVNCAAPIAYGLHRAGSRLETTLATMMSSPTLNVVVLSMLFSLFPLHLALLKIGATLAFILVVIPLLSRFLFQHERDARASLAESSVEPDASATASAQPQPIEAMHSWSTALAWTLAQFARRLWTIGRVTVPLMLLAGLLGATLLTLLPWESLVWHLQSLSWWQKGLSLGGLALIGLFVPVPMAFDVFLSYSLLSAGLPARDVMVLLFTLGIFSVYSFSIVGRFISWRVAVVLSATLAAFGAGSGVAAHYVDRWQVERQDRLFWQAFSQSDPDETPRPELPRGHPWPIIESEIRPHRLVRSPAGIAGRTGVTVERVRFHPRGTSTNRFIRRDGADLGFHSLPPRSLVLQFALPFTHVRGVAAGDVHNDGWPDVVLGSRRGLFLYANVKGETFELQRIDIPALQDKFIAVAALVDLNNDGWLDMFVSTFRAGNFVVYNRRGQFTPDRLVPISEGASTLANAVAFGDLERDGRLEIIVGNYASGIARLRHKDSRNAVLRLTEGGVRADALPGMPGETLTALVSDLNRDGHPDLIVGNDFDEPDVFYLNDGRGRLSAIGAADEVIPHTTYFTMSADSADLDNDLDLEVYVGQISGTESGDEDRLTVRPVSEVCQDLPGPTDKSRCRANLARHAATARLHDPGACTHLDREEDRLDCLAYKLFIRARDSGSTRYCDLFPARWDDLAHLCKYVAQEGQPSPRGEPASQITQIGGRNVLLWPMTDGTYADRAEAMGVDIAGWTWNARFADLDNDEWQDLYVVNGYYSNAYRESNMFFHNQRGARFLERTEEVGLADFFATGAYAYVDYDLDGDLDVLTVPFEGNVTLYENEMSDDHSVAFELRDRVGNRFGIGSSIIVRYGDGRAQLRELKAGGGYISFDPPVAYFGLGRHDHVSEVEVRWSTGEVTKVRGPLAADALYRIGRETRNQ